MKTIAVLLGFFALACGIVSGQEPKTNSIPPKIPASEAKEHVNSEGTVSGKVIELYKTEKLVRLNLDKAFPNQPFTVVIFGTKTNLFPDLDKLKGKTIGYIFFDGGYGREPLPLLEQFAKDYGFDLKLYPVPPAEMQNQSGLWLGVRRDKPDWMIMWGWGAMNPTAVKEATKINFPMDKFVGIWWSGSEDDTRPSSPESKGYLSLNLNGIGANYPAIQDIKKHIVDKGKGQTNADRLGENYYNRGVLNSVIVAEAIRNAQKITGKKVVNGEDVRRGFETLKISAERFKELGLENFAAPITNVSCQDHNGHHAAFMQQWDGTKWVKISDWITPMKDKVRPMLEAASKDYVSKDTAWPKRSEPCDKSS